MINLVKSFRGIKIENINLDFFIQQFANSISLRTWSSCDVVDFPLRNPSGPVAWIPSGPVALMSSRQ